MASKLCCTAEQEGRPGSPELPNVRVTEATPKPRPLLPKPNGSPNSRFTSARSDELHELQQIFNSAKDYENETPTPAKPPRTHLNRASIYSLHSLHKMKSMHSILRRRFSKDLSKKPSDSHVKPSHTSKHANVEDANTVVKPPQARPNLRLQIAKADLRKDLLSDKRPDEGGYDPDAKVLNDVAKDFGKRTPTKRPSIHSIEWTSTTRYDILSLYVVHVILISPAKRPLGRLRKATERTRPTSSDRTRSSNPRAWAIDSVMCSALRIYKPTFQKAEIASPGDLILPHLMRSLCKPLLRPCLQSDSLV